MSMKRLSVEGFGMCMPIQTAHSLTSLRRKGLNPRFYLSSFITSLFMLLTIPALVYGFDVTRPIDTKGLSTLNVRLSSKAIHPPQELVVTTLNLPDIAIAKPMVGPPSKSAILENDQRHRLIVLTSEESGNITVYVLDKIDLAPYLQSLRTLTTNRGCAHDRMTITGGLGCVAISLKEIIEAEILP
ncbi:MAG: hypothetical protein NPIRA05_15990 [Nitrospirales bacterium]|nr:MAG: hypothetical protein NPIRA05_15990 [Nitrospirales bacterium]